MYLNLLMFYAVYICEQLTDASNGRSAFFNSPAAKTSDLALI
jgi:hypothetical protein